MTPPVPETNGVPTPTVRHVPRPTDVGRCALRGPPRRTGTLVNTFRTPVVMGPRTYTSRVEVRRTTGPRTVTPRAELTVTLVYITPVMTDTGS